MVETKSISIERIVITGDNPRQTFNEESLRRLGESIKTHGLLQPIIVRPKEGYYELVVGERRLKAAQLVGLTEIDSQIQDLDDATSMELRLIENTHREDLTDAEKGDAVLALLEKYPYKYPTMTSLAEAIETPDGTVRVWIQKSRKLSDYVKELINSALLTDRHAQSLLKYDYTTQDRLAKAMVKHKIDSVQARTFIKLYDVDPDAGLDDLADELLGVKKVEIETKKLTEEARQEVEEIVKERERDAKEARIRALEKARRAKKAAKKAWETRRKGKLRGVELELTKKTLLTPQEPKIEVPSVQTTVTVEKELIQMTAEEMVKVLSEMEPRQRDKKLTSIQRILKSREKKPKEPLKPKLRICPRCGTRIWLEWDYIVLFDKTPPDIVCPHFYELRWAFGCPYQCSYCYLQGTFYGRKTPPRLRYRSPGEKERLAKEVRYFFKFNKPYPQNFVLNTGELADSLMDERRDDPFSKFIISLFEEQDRHKVLFLTKSDRVENLVEIGRHNQAIISFSINAPEVAARYEVGTPSPERRIEAATMVKTAGYNVRIRIDPMIPIEGWEEQYLNLVNQIFGNFTPDRITLGSIRGLNKTLLFAKGDTSWKDWLVKETGWGLKIEDELRERMYRLIINQLHEKFKYTNIALCKETKTMWERLKMNWTKCRCNCVW